MSTSTLAETAVSGAATYDPNDEKFDSIRTAAEFSQHGVQSIREAIWRGDLPAYQPAGKGGRVLIRRSDLIRWMTRRTVDVSEHQGGAL